MYRLRGAHPSPAPDIERPSPPFLQALGNHLYLYPTALPNQGDLLIQKLVKGVWGNADQYGWGNPVDIDDLSGQLRGLEIRVREVGDGDHFPETVCSHWSIPVVFPPA
jgi:hypothetical protein